MRAPLPRTPRLDAVPAPRGHSTVIGHRDSAGNDVSHVWQATATAATARALTGDAFRAAAGAFELG